jgi:hypothetical protein
VKIGYLFGKLFFYGDKHMMNGEFDLDVGEVKFCGLSCSGEPVRCGLERWRQTSLEVLVLRR